MTDLSCSKCGLPTGSRLVCKTCQKYLTDAERQELTRRWHDLVCERFRLPYTDDAGQALYLCYHCGWKFPREKVCGDHFPVTKGSSEAVRFDVDAGVCSCSACNTSGNDNRKRSMKAHPKYEGGLCKKCRLLIPINDGLCLKCL